MTKVTGSFTTAPQDFPEGTVAVGFLLTLTETTSGAVLTGTADLGSTEVSIADVPPGTYGANIALVDAAGAALAPAVSAPDPVTVSPPAPVTVTLAVPATLAVSAS